MLVACSLILAFWITVFVGVERLVPGTAPTEHELKKRLISILHGSITFPLSAGYLLRTGMGFCDEATSEEKTLVLFSMTYFAFDLAACVRSGICDGNLALHHSCSILGFLVAFVAPFGAKCSIYGLFVTGASNAPMNLRAILRIRGKRHTKLYEVMAISYLSLYLVFRGLFAPCSVFYCVSCPRTPGAITLMGILLTSQSWHFIAKMLGIIKKKVNELEERRGKALALWWLEVNPTLGGLTYFNKNGSQGIF